MTERCTVLQYVCVCVCLCVCVSVCVCVCVCVLFGILWFWYVSSFFGGTVIDGILKNWLSSECSGARNRFCLFMQSVNKFLFTHYAAGTILRAGGYTSEHKRQSLDPHSTYILVEVGRQINTHKNI